MILARVYFSILILATLMGMGNAFAQNLNAPKGDAIMTIPFPVAQANPQSWRAVDPENLIVFDTTKGRILIEILDEAAPNHGVQFRKHVRSGDYAGTSFHRVIDGFMAQGGDIEMLHNRTSPLPDLAGEFTFQRGRDMAFDPVGEDALNATQGYSNGFPVLTQPGFMADMTADGLVSAYIPHCQGVVSTARTNDPNSANAQFFLMRDHSPHLDQQYTAWGIVRVGVDIVRALKKGPSAANGSVTDPDILVTAQMAADMENPPKLLVMRTDSEEFANGFLAPLEGVDICDHPAIPVVVG